jgi:MFS family permease
MSFASAQEPRWVDVYAAAIVRAISMCGDFLAATALALVLADRGAASWAVAALLLAAAVPPVVLAPLVGRIADRLDSRAILFVTGVGQVAVCVALAAVTNPVLIVALVAVLGAGFALTGPTLSALVPLMVGRDNLPRAVGISQTSSTMAMLAAPALGGFLVGQFGARVPLLIDAATYLALPIGAFVIKTRRGGAARSVTADGTAPARYRLRDDGLLWTLLVMTTASIAAISAVNVIEVFFVRHTLHGSATTFGVIGATWMAGMVVGAAIWGRFKHSDLRVGLVLAGLLLASGVDLAAAALAPSALWLVPLWLLGGVINGGVNVSLSVLLGRRVPSAARGRAGATFNSMANTANAAGYLLGGALLAAWSPRVLVLACGIAGVLAVVLFVRNLSRSMERERSLGATAAAEASTADQPAELIPAM